MNISSYGISVTTLEQVFLKVGHGDDGDGDKQVKAELQRMESKEDIKNLYSIADQQESGVCNVFLDHLGALIRKRLHQYRRNYKGLVVEILVPVLLVLIGFAFSKVQFFVSSPNRPLSPDLFPLKQRIVVNQNLVRSSPPNDISPKQLIESLPMFAEAFDVTYKDYSYINTTTKGGEAFVL